MRLPRVADSLERLRHDLRLGLRVLAQAPMFTGVAILSLALGIGANTAIFSLVNTVMLKMLPVREPERLVHVRANDIDTTTAPIWEQVRDRQQAFDGLFAWAADRLDESAGGEAHYLRGLYTSATTFDVLGVTPILGRTWRPEDDVRGGGRDGAVAILSYAFWRDRYGASPDVLGQTVRLRGQLFTIVGVLPPGFLGLEVGSTFDVAIPLAAEEIIRGTHSVLNDRTTWWLTMMGRLRRGQDASQAEALLQPIYPAVRESTMPIGASGGERAGYFTDPFSVRPAATGLSASRRMYGSALLWLMGAVALVLLITCANLANLSLARATARRRELAVKMALGASRARLVRQLLIESLLLATAGAMFGLLFAQWAVRLLVRALSTSRLPMVLDVTLDTRVLAFTMGVALLASVLFGLAPACRSTGVSASEALALRSGSGARTAARGWGFAGARGGGGLARGVGRRVGHRVGMEALLVAAQIALSLVLVFGAGLFVRSFGALLTVDAGFDPRRVLIARADASRIDVPPAQLIPLYDRLLEAVRALPDVRDASYATLVPIRGGYSNTIVDVPGYVAKGQRDRVVMNHRVAPGYFATMGIAMRAGRDFTNDDGPGARRVVIINEAFARKFFGGGESGSGESAGSSASLVGRVFRMCEAHDASTELEIIGVVKDAKYRELRLDAPPAVYFAFRQESRPWNEVQLFIRARGDESKLAPSIAHAVAGVDSGVSLEFRRFETQIADSLLQERLLASLSSAFGLLALTVAGLGLYGMLSLAISRRRHELGIRAALGAAPDRLVRLVLRDVATIAIIGLATGATAAALIGRFITSLLYGLDPMDPVAWLTAIIPLLVITAVASYIPARRAGRLDPMTALRLE